MIINDGMTEETHSTRHPKKSTVLHSTEAKTHRFLQRGGE